MATQTYTFYSTTPTSSLVADERPNQAIYIFDVTTDLETNKSTVNWTLKAGGTDTSQFTYWYMIDFRYGVGANWATTYARYTKLLTKEETKVYCQDVVATGSFEVDHLTDGTQKMGVYFEAIVHPSPDSLVTALGSSSTKMFSERNYISGHASPIGFDLPTIPRTSTVVCTTAEIGRNPTFTITSPSTNFTHTLRYKFGSLSGTIATGLGEGAYNKWSIPTSFLDEIEDKSYGEGTIYCDTYNSAGELNGTSTTTFRVNVSSQYGPNMDPVIKDSSHASKLLTGDENKIIQYYNTVSYDIGAYTSTGAYITNYYISCGSKSNTASSGTLKNVESGTFNISVTDSRGFTTTKTVYKTLVPYIKLTAKMKLVSIDTNGSGSVSISGNMFRGSFGIVDNEPVISYRWKAENGEWSNWSEVVYSITNDSYYAEVQFQGLDYQGTYLFEAKAVDQLMTVEPEALVVKCMPVYDWDDKDFQFNVPVTINGNLTITGEISGGGASPADYIVDQGTVTTGSGNSAASWVYRKWNSGVAECWCRKHVSTAVNTAWGGLYVSGALSYTNITWGVDFIDIPVANITIAPNASGAFLIAGGSTSLTKDNTGGYEIARGSALASAGNFYINYYGIGKWK